MTDTTGASVSGGNGEAAPITSSPAPGTVPTTSEPAATWYSGFDQETLGWMENRGLTKMDQNKALEAAINGHRNAEKYMGVPADKLARIPDWEKADKVELDQFFGKLGRPSSPNDYKLPLPEGSSPEFAKEASTWFHEAGLNERQANAVVTKWNDYVQSITVRETETAQSKFQEQEASLKREWGAAFEQEVGFAKNATRALGLNEQQVSALENALGFDGLLKMMNSIGKKTGEAKFVTGESSTNGPMTPAQAKARIDTLRNDKEWVNKYLSGNVDARAEMERLHQFMVAA
jgi:hypothetical protein